MTWRQEIWHQDPFEKDVWVGEDGLLVSPAALDERASYFEVGQVPVQPVPVYDNEPVSDTNLRWALSDPNFNRLSSRATKQLLCVS